MLLRIFIVVALFCLVPFAASSQEDAVPTLTELQRLQLQSSLLRVENAQLRVQLAQDAFESARLSTQDLLSQLQKPGYRLDLQKLVYVKAEPVTTK